MGVVMFMRKGEVHTAPAEPVYLTDDDGNIVTAASVSTDEQNGG